MLITDERFFTEELDKSFPGLEGIDVTFKEEGLAAAEKRLSDFVKKTVRADDYFRIPYYERENDWAYRSEDDFAAAERIMRGELMSCGYMYKFPDGKIDWQINPTDNGYKEWTWQLSRHHEWRCLAKCYRDTGDERYARSYVDFLTSWCEQAVCPENISGGATLCWRTLEAGLRMIKCWHYAFFAFLKSPAMTDHVVCTYMKSIWEHGYRIRNFCTSGNWLSTELTGLWHIGALYPFLKNVPGWKEYALRRICEQLDVQFYPDGFQYELTTGYHGVVLANYRYLTDTASALGEVLPEYLRTRLAEAYETYIKLAQPDGRTPALNDGGRAGVAHETGYAAAMFPEREDFLWSASHGQKGKAPLYTSVALPYSGMAIMRTGWGKDDAYLFMESAPFGYGHQHEDKLNVIMYAYGKELLPDPGTYAYDTSDMRKFIIGSYSHNVGCVDGFGQNRRATHSFPAEEIKKRSDLTWNFSEDTDSAEGTYDRGFGPELIKVTQKRKVVFFKKGLNGSGAFALVIDRFVSDDGEPHVFETHWQMPYVPFTASGKVFCASYGDGVTLSLIAGEEHTLKVGQKKPCMMEWRPVHAPGGTEPEHLPAPSVGYISGKKMSHRRVLLLYPSRDGKKAISGVEYGDDVSDTLITLVINGERVTVDENDYPCASDNAEKLRV